MGDNEENRLPEWHTLLNIATVIGGCILFAGLLVGSYLGWRLNQHEG